ncbi:HAD-like domain-containing protein [Geopyxis carbonaria]|nr:HAD-like domain-containing protein [Geopyxis carbonaria]
MIAQRPLPTPSDVKLLVSDVDGTLLDSHHQLPTSNKTYQILTRLRKTHPDLPIIISTGKQRTSTAELRAQLDLEGFYCCHLNGNVIYKPSGEILSESALDIEVVRRVYQTLRERPGVSFFVYDYTTVYQVLGGENAGEGMWAERLRGYGEDVREMMGPSAERVKEGEALMEKVWKGEVKVIKMAICQDEAPLAETRAMLEAAFTTDDFAIVQALTFCAEFIPAKNNKGTALETLLAHLGMDTKGVVAFGDGENDVSMFGVAEMSVAMGNAMDKAKDVATWTTGTNDEGGVGMWLEKVFYGVPN